MSVLACPSSCETVRSEIGFPRSVFWIRAVVYERDRQVVSRRRVLLEREAEHLRHLVDLEERRHGPFDLKGRQERHEVLAHFEDLR